MKALKELTKRAVDVLRAHGFGAVMEHSYRDLIRIRTTKPETDE